jgi:hypothetical protein
MPVAFAKDELNGWKTPPGIGLGSSEQEVLHAYGKPSREEKIDSRIYKQLIKGYKKGDSLPDAGEKELVYGLARFGMRNGKVSYIWLSYSE